MKFSENLSEGSGDMERRRKCYERANGRTDRGRDICVMLNEILSKGSGFIWSEHDFKGKSHGILV